MFITASTKMEYDYLTGWIKNGQIRSNLTQNGEPKRYSGERRRRRSSLYQQKFIFVTLKYCRQTLSKIEDVYKISVMVWMATKQRQKRMSENSSFFCPLSLATIVVRCPPRERKILGSNPACAGIFSGSSHTSESKIGTPVATLPGA